MSQLNDSLPGLLLDPNLRIITFQEREEKKTKIMMKTAYTFRPSSRRDYKLPMMKVASSLPEGEERTVTASFRSPVAQLYLPNKQVYIFLGVESVFISLLVLELWYILGIQLVARQFHLLRPHCGLPLDGLIHTNYSWSPSI